MAKTGFLFAQEGYAHETGDSHPERPARLKAIEDAFAAAGLKPPRIPFEEATREQLLRVHDEAHIEFIEKTCANNARYPDPDTPMGKGSWQAALLGAGAAIAGCRAVLNGDVDSAFSAMRPPGHHAERDRAMGFCLFNNVAVAAQWLRHEGGLERVAILDWDVHHGNGTQHSFYEDPTVYYASLHEFPHYPGTGTPDERGAGDANLNIPMAPGTAADSWIEAIKSEILPEFQRFDPQFLLISCGFDAHKNDPLGSQNLTEAHFVEMTRMIKDVAGGKIVSLLEGGYDLEALGKSAVAHFEALSE